MEQKTGFTKMWIFLYSLVAVIFFIVGLVMIIFDTAIINGSQYLLTSILFGSTAFFLIRKKISINFSNPKLIMGFIFSIIGLAGSDGITMIIGIWVLGTALFFWGIFEKNS